MGKQLQIAGTEAEDHAEINEAAEALRVALAEHKRMAENVTKAKGTLIACMMAKKTAVYEYLNATKGRFRLDLTLPDPSVRLTFVGQEDDC